jgi:hypothetical protein
MYIFIHKYTQTFMYYWDANVLLMCCLMCCFYYCDVQADEIGLLVLVSPSFLNPKP